MNVIINIDVPELAPAIAFYTAALGLSHSRTLDDDVAELTGASATLYLLQKDPGTRAVKAAGGGPRLSPPLDSGAFRPGGARRRCRRRARALAAGARQETGHVDWRGSRCISFGDPFGHGFCFIQFERNGTYES